MAGPTIRFVGRAAGAQKAELFARCTAFILPAIEDFGITPLEAMASGRPVIAIGAGGALDTVIPGVTGEFFEDQTSESLAATLQRFNADAYDPNVILHHAKSFCSDRFRRQIADAVNAAWRRHSRFASTVRPDRSRDGTSLCEGAMDG